MKLKGGCDLRVMKELHTHYFFHLRTPHVPIELPRHDFCDYLRGVDVRRRAEDASGPRAGGNQLLSGMGQYGFEVIEKPAPLAIR